MKKIFVVMISLLLCFSMSACGTTSSSNGGTTGEESAESGTEGGTTSAEAASQEAADLMEIETTYGTLFFPAEWEEYLVTEETLEDGLLSISFSAKVEAGEYSLFKVMICDEEGDSVGTINDADGATRNVFVEIFELSDISDLDEEAQNQLYAMQEGVNTLIEELG